MVNFGLNGSFILGIFLAVAGAALYFLRSARPELSRDYDIFFSAVGLVCGLILMFNGWRLDPVLQVGQLLLTVSTVFFAVESIRLRGIATEQARRNTPTVDRDRPVSKTRVYREEDNERSIPQSYGYANAKPNYDSPRLRGYEDPEPRPTRRSSVNRPEGRYPNSRNRNQQYDSGDFPRERTQKRPAPNRDRYDQWNQEDSWDEPNYNQRPRSSREEDSYNDDYSRNTPPRKPSNVEDFGRDYQSPEEPRNYDDGLGRGYDDGLGQGYEEDDNATTDYVDYQPLDSEDTDYPSDYQKNNDEFRGASDNVRYDRKDRREPKNPDFRDDFEY